MYLLGWNCATPRLFNSMSLEIVLRRKQNKTKLENILMKISTIHFFFFFQSLKFYWYLQKVVSNWWRDSKYISALLTALHVVKIINLKEQNQLNKLMGFSLWIICLFLFFLLEAQDLMCHILLYISFCNLTN